MRLLLLTSAWLLMLAGCGTHDSAPAGATVANDSSQSAAVGTTTAKSAGAMAAESQHVATQHPAAPAPRREFKPVRLDGRSASEGNVSQASTPDADATETNARSASSSPTPRVDDFPAGDPQSNPAFARLQELQVMLGEWRGTTRRKFGDFNSVETVRWKWDLLTDKSQPALVFDTTDSPYFQQARLMYVAATEKFRLTATDKAGVDRVYEGAYTREPQLVPGDDPTKPQRVFKLQLDQIEPAGGRELARVVFNQQNNNRYLLELYRQSGGRTVIHDTVANQREGTSFALIDEGYGERTCIISEGLGTMTVTHNGRTYYVCCTGCQAAFNENPEYWIAKAEERSGERKSPKAAGGRD